MTETNDQCQIFMKAVQVESRERESVSPLYVDALHSALLFLPLFRRSLEPVKQAGGNKANISA